MDRTTSLKVARELIQHPQYGLLANGADYWVVKAYLQAIKLDLGGMPIGDDVWLFLRLSVTDEPIRLLALLDLAIQGFKVSSQPINTFLERFASQVHTVYATRHPGPLYGPDPFRRWYEDDLMYKAIRNMLV